jgi:hypothetical protein
MVLENVQPSKSVHLYCPVASMLVHSAMVLSGLVTTWLTGNPCIMLAQ